MRSTAISIGAVLAAGMGFAAKVEVSSLPEAARPLAEVETNVAFSAGVPSDNLWSLSIAASPLVGSSIEVLLGCDSDGDGVLALEESELSVGRDCGDWFWRDVRGGAWDCVEAAESGGGSLFTLRLGAGKTAKSFSDSVFSGDVPATFFSPEWNMMRVVSRGASLLDVESKVYADGLRLRVR